MATVTDEDFAAWKADPVTQTLMDKLTQEVSDIKDAWAEGSFTGDTMEQTLQMNGKAIGKVQSLEDILNLTVEDLNNG